MNDLTIELTDRGEKYLYQQIYEYIRDENEDEEDFFVDEGEN